MSEKILRALMQLFAIIAKVEIIPSQDLLNEEENILRINSIKDSAVVESFLKSELNSLYVKKYLDLFEEFIQTHHGLKSKKDGVKKRASVNSVKVLRICAQINEELAQRQKFIVLIRLFEFINSFEVIEEQEIVFVKTVSEMFNISNEEFEVLKSFVDNSISEIIDNSDLLYISNINHPLDHSKRMTLDGLDQDIRVLKIQSINTFFYRYFGQDDLIMNGQIVSNKVHVLNQGSTIKTQKSTAVYYSDISSKFLNDELTEKITFKVNELEYIFKGGKKGIQPLNLIEESGKLLGIMGGSGAGKSTLLNILNGNLHPSKGSVTINGIDIHKESDKLDGVIGFISQDDLLIEELTVYQNLFYNTKLCFKNLSELAIKKKVIKMLHSVGLNEAKNLVVGNPLQQTISGGQRKRLNIALELIREPAVLFVDEPTSGLSSRDSENIIDLLKELTFRGKLIFVVIHQPSSEIFKMFDRLLILDKGGYSIFDGNPVDAIVYFKTHINHVNCEERECYACGNVNPEQIFNIIESKIVNEYGELTSERKTSPSEWNELFLKNNNPITLDEQLFTLKSSSKIPNKLNQFYVFFTRDLLSKLANQQYMLINFIEAPLLAFILSFFIKYYNKSANSYSFYENVNIPQYLFISVIVALFLGLTVSAEEIFKDKKILKRESFLNLSRSSYLLSKISILFIISAIQSFLFVIIGNSILEIKAMWVDYWIVLFSISCLANIIGLNISSAFNSVKVIYIIVPIIIIPQLLFSGVIVKYDKLNPIFSKSPNEVPWLGNNIAIRWAYEALAVTQSINNNYETIFFDLNQEKSNADWKKDFWIPEMKNQLTNLTNDKISSIEFVKSKNILTNEIVLEQNKWTNLECKSCLDELKSLKKSTDKTNLTKNINSFLTILNNQYIQISNEKTVKIESIIKKIGNENFSKLKNENENESLNKLVTNQNELDKIIITETDLKQKDNPIYIDPKNERFFDSPFYSPNKYVFGVKISTFWSNVIVLWLMSVSLIIALYYNWLKKGLKYPNYLTNKLTKKK